MPVAPPRRNSRKGSIPDTSNFSPSITKNRKVSRSSTLPRNATMMGRPLPSTPPTKHINLQPPELPSPPAIPVDKPTTYPIQQHSITHNFSGYPEIPMPGNGTINSYIASIPKEKVFHFNESEQRRRQSEAHQYPIQREIQQFSNGNREIHQHYPMNGNNLEIQRQFSMNGNGELSNHFPMNGNDISQYPLNGINDINQYPLNGNDMHKYPPHTLNGDMHHYPLSGGDFQRRMSQNGMSSHQMMIQQQTQNVS